MNAWQLWVVAGIGLVILEMLTPGFIVMIFGLGCIAPAVLAALGVGVPGQLVGFAAFTLVLFVAVRPFALKHIHRNAPELKTNTDALVGRAGVVSERISVAAGTGRMKCHGDDWKARSQDPAREFEAGARVRVVAVDGITVLVAAE